MVMAMMALFNAAYFMVVLARTFKTVLGFFSLVSTLAQCCTVVRVFIL